MPKTKIAAVIQGKGTTVHSVSPDDTVYDALKFMAEVNVGALLVTEDGKVAGIISERDYTRKIALFHKSSSETKISEIMTSNVVTISPQHTVDEAMATMTSKGIRHLPVLDDQEQLVGLVSIGDLVKTVIENQKQVIQQLESYIQGN